MFSDLWVVSLYLIYDDNLISLFTVDSRYMGVQPVCIKVITLFLFLFSFTSCSAAIFAYNQRGVFEVQR